MANIALEFIIKTLIRHHLLFLYSICSYNLNLALKKLNYIISLSGSNHKFFSFDFHHKFPNNNHHRYSLRYIITHLSVEIPYNIYLVNIVPLLYFMDRVCLVIYYCLN